MLRSQWCLFPVAVLAQFASAQSADDGRELTAPVLGYYVADSTASVRPIMGAPGAVIAGDALALPDGVTSVSAAPGRRFAIVERAGAAESAIYSFSTGAIHAIENTFPHSDRTAFSPSSSVAVLYSASAKQALVISGLPGNARIERTIDLSSAGLPVTAVAVSDDAQFVLGGVSDGSNGAVWTFAAGRDPVQIGGAGVPSSIRFAAGKHDAAMADSGWQQVSFIENGAAIRRLAGTSEGLTSPSDLDFAADAQTIWAADASAGLFRIETGSGAVTIADGVPASARIARLSGASVFLLTSKDGASVWTPDSGNPAWRIVSAAAAGANPQ